MISEPVKKEQISGLVYEVVGDSFDELVIKSEKDVFIMFYTDDCVKC